MTTTLISATCDALLRNNSRARPVFSENPSAPNKARKMSNNGEDAIAISPVILSGGSGSRLWPVSRASHPKQFLSLGGAGTMLQETARRVSDSAGFGTLTVIAGEAQRFEVAEQIRAVGLTAEIVLEPVARNTALPIAIAALMAESDESDPVVLIMAADHFIPDTEAFISTARAACRLARDKQRIVTFGITPTSPETGYGYIRAGKSLGQEGAYEIRAFVEKPDAETAKKFIAQDDYFWNASLFAAPASVLLDAFAKHAPDVLSAAKDCFAASTRDLDFLRLGTEGCARAPDISFDYAVMEHIDCGAVVSAGFAWSDLGSWNALYQVSPHNDANTAIDGNIVSLDCEDSFLRSDGPALGAIGLKNIVVVATPDAVLVADRDRTEDVKAIVMEFKNRNCSAATETKLVRRPWGSYESLATGSRFQVKRIIVKPNGKLSLQSHHHRAEHWIVVSGTALVTLGETEQLLSENESAYIPLGVLHRLENPGKLDLVLIEVQSGAYLGEDDIKRYDDIYARN